MRHRRATVFLVSAVVLLATAAAASAADLEIGVGTEPSVSLAAVWDLSPSLSVAVSFGAVFGNGVQTGSFTLQTASYILGVEARYNVRLATPIVEPYLGLGAFVRAQGGAAEVLMSSSVGARIRVLPNIWLIGEGTAFVPIFDIAEWTWRLKLAVGFRFAF